MMSVTTIVILVLIAFITGLIVGISLTRPAYQDWKKHDKLPGDSTTDAPSPETKKNPKGK